MKLKAKIMLGGIIIVVVSMLISTLIVSFMIKRQNRDAALDNLDQSFLVIRDDIRNKERRLMEQTDKVAKRSDLVDTVSFFIDSKEEAGSLYEKPLRDLTGQIRDIGLMENLWKLGIYDDQGDLVICAVIEGENIYLGFAHGSEDGMEYKTAEVRKGDEVSFDKWEITDNLKGIEKSVKFDDSIQSSVSFKTQDNRMYMISFSPILGDEYKKVGEKTIKVKKKVGFVTFSLILDHPFLKRLSSLTGTKINLFIKNRLSSGMVTDYKTLEDSVVSRFKTGSRKLNDGAEIVISDRDLGGNDFFEGILPLYGGGEWQGAISALYSKDVFQKNSRETIKTLVLISFICILVVLPVAFLFSRSLSRPIIRTVDMLKDIAEGEGDLTKRLELKSKDEIAELAKWFNTFIAKIQSLIKEISENSQTLSSSAASLSSISDDMSKGSGDMSNKSETVSNAAKEMSSNMEAVAAASEQASTNMSIVAVATEEMTLSINEIAMNAEKTRNVTGDAVSQAKRASDNVNKLGIASREINKVTEAITEISDQTNLLALNATIEAARAGEAGKGFAVVANEIKDLARQTAISTDEIKQKVDEIQNSTDMTVAEIENISNVINGVNELVSSIAGAVEEQSTTTGDIAANVGQASQGIQEVNTNVIQSSSVSREIADEIAEVNQTSSDMTNSSMQVNSKAIELSRLSDQLKNMVGKFKL